MFWSVLIQETLHTFRSNTQNDATQNALGANDAVMDDIDINVQVHPILEIEPVNVYNDQIIEMQEVTEGDAYTIEEVQTGTESVGQINDTTESEIQK